MSDLFCARLNNGLLMPAISLGTYALKDGDKTRDVALAAMKLGYYGIDTADYYENQRCLGEAIRTFEPKMITNERLVQREGVSHFEVVDKKTFYDSLGNDRKVFVTGKFFPTKYTPEGIEEQMNTFFKQIGRSADLMLMHWPANMDHWSTKEEMTSAENEKVRQIVWQQMEQYLADGKVRAIGVSNFMTKHLQPFIDDIFRRKAAGDTKATLPAMNQIEISPYCRPSPCLVELMKKHNIKFTSYSTMGSDRNNYREDQKIKGLAAEVGKSPSQVILRWALQKGYLVLPRTSQAAHAQENLECLYFSLSQDQMNKMDALYTGRDVRIAPDPNLAS